MGVMEMKPVILMPFQYLSFRMLQFMTDLGPAWPMLDYALLSGNDI